MSEEEEVSNVSKKKNKSDTGLLFSPASYGISGLYNPVSIFGLSTIPEALNSCNLGSFAMAAETLSSCNLGSFAMAAEVAESYNSRLSAMAAEVAESYNSRLSAMAAEVAESYNSRLSAMAAETLKSYNLGISAAAAEALSSCNLGSFAEMSEALKDASILQPSIISEALKNITTYSAPILETFKSPTLYSSVISEFSGYSTFGLFSAISEATKDVSNFHISLVPETQKLSTFCSSVVFEKLNLLKNPSVEEMGILSLNAEDPRQIFPNLTATLENVENLEDLGSKVQNDYEIMDFEINSKAYKFLCNLETYLRHLITKRIIEPYEKNLISKIPQDVLSRCEERKRQDSLNEYGLIDYSDFTDLKKIFEKGKNRDLFKDLFNDEECKALITKLHELDPIRKKIAHFRPLTKKEFNRLVLYHDDIFIIVKARQHNSILKRDKF